MNFDEPLEADNQFTNPPKGHMLYLRHITAEGESILHGLYQAGHKDRVLSHIRREMSESGLRGRFLISIDRAELFDDDDEGEVFLNHQLTLEVDRIAGMEVRHAG